MSSTTRTHKRSHYTQIDNSLLENPNISLQAKGLQAYLLSKPDGWNISSRHLATTCTCGIDKVQSTLRELEAIGYIRREKTYGLGGKIQWVSHIYESLDLNPYLDKVDPTMTGLSSHGSTSHGSTSHGSTSHGSTSHGKPSHIVKTEKAKTERTKTEQVNTHPTLSQKSANADVCVDGCLEVEILEPEPEQATTLVQPNSSNSSLVVSGISGEERSSGGCSTITYQDSATANHQSRMSNVLTTARIAAIALEIKDWYNQSKPANWGACRNVTGKINRDCDTHIRRYLSYGRSIDEACDSFLNDWKAAILAVSASEWHTSPKFENGNIAWLLNPNATGRIEDFAMLWQSKGEVAQEAIVQKIVTSVTDEPVYNYHTKEIVTDYTSKLLLEKRYRKWLTNGSPNCPPVEYLQKYFPQLLSEKN